MPGGEVLGLGNRCIQGRLLPALTLWNPSHPLNTVAIAKYKTCGPGCHTGSDYGSIITGLCVMVEAQGQAEAAVHSHYLVCQWPLHTLYWLPQFLRLPLTPRTIILQFKKKNSSIFIKYSIPKKLHSNNHNGKTDLITVTNSQEYKSK